MQVLVLNSGSSSIKFRLGEVVEEPKGLLTARPALLPGRAAKISVDGSRLAAYVVAVDEETWIARETVRCVRGVSS